MNSSPSYVDRWWKSKSVGEYGLQPKHAAAAALLNEFSFPLVDLGAGNGVFLRAVENSFVGEECVGVELSGLAIQEKLCRSKIEEGSVLDWRPEGRVGTAALIDVLEHLNEPVLLLEQVATYAETILIACPNFNFITARFDVLRGRVPFQNRPARGGHVFWCQYFNLKKMFTTCGLRILNENHLYPRNESRLLRGAGRLRPSLFAFEFVFLLGKAKQEK